MGGGQILIVLGENLTWFGQHTTGEGVIFIGGGRICSCGGQIVIFYGKHYYYGYGLHIYY